MTVLLPTLLQSGHQYGAQDRYVCFVPVEGVTLLFITPTKMSVFYGKLITARTYSRAHPA